MGVNFVLSAEGAPAAGLLPPPPPLHSPCAALDSCNFHPTHHPTPALLTQAKPGLHLLRQHSCGCQLEVECLACAACRLS